MNDKKQPIDLDDFSTTIETFRARSGKGPSPYNVYMKAKVAELGQTHPDLTPEQRFQLAASLWMVS